MTRARGAAAVEFLLVVPVLVILFLGILSLSLAAGLRADLHMVARAGAQWAIQTLENAGNSSGIVAAAQAAAGDLAVPVDVVATTVCGCLDTGTGTFTAVDCATGSCPLPDPRPHTYVRVTASAQYPLPWTIPGLPGTWQLESRVELRTR